MDTSIMQLLHKFVKVCKTSVFGVNCLEICDVLSKVPKWRLEETAE